ncbi:hypothetical protein KI387_040855, partial [Taxus chinensis]
MATIGSLLEIASSQPQAHFLVEHLLMPAYDLPENTMVCEIVGPNNPWYHDLYTFIRDKTFPADMKPMHKRALAQRASRYTILAETLYKRGYDGTLLRCLNQEESSSVLAEVHSGICGAHMNGIALAKKILRVGYYWPTMESDACHFVKHCQACQKHGNLIHAPSQALQSITTPWPFSQWGLDLIGKIRPTSSDGHKFIITATDYFTKWVEAMPLTYVTGSQISKFIFNNLICRFGIPSALVADN